MDPPVDSEHGVHQYTRLLYSPKHSSHKIGMKRITRYLKGSRDKELLMVPNMRNTKLDLFDSTGLFAVEDTSDPTGVKHKSKILLNFRNIPIFWSSKLQTDIDIST